MTQTRLTPRWQEISDRKRREVSARERALAKEAAEKGGQPMVAVLTRHAALKGIRLDDETYMASHKDALGELIASLSPTEAYEMVVDVLYADGELPETFMGNLIRRLERPIDEPRLMNAVIYAADRNQLATNMREMLRKRVLPRYAIPAA